MKLELKFIVFIFLFFPLIFQGQINSDSLMSIWQNQSNPDSIRVSALNDVLEEYSLSPEDAFSYSKEALKFANSNNIKSEKERALKSVEHSMSALLKEQKSFVRKERFIFFGLGIILFFGLIYFFRKKMKKIKSEKEDLIGEMEILKEKITTQSISSTTIRKNLILDKGKIEKAINSQLGESSWKILNLIFEDPSISNKEIATMVSLSIEGVSSSLRRMYVSFDIHSSSNKKIALVQKATQISFES